MDKTLVIEWDSCENLADLAGVIIEKLGDK